VYVTPVNIGISVNVLCSVSSAETARHVVSVLASIQTRWTSVG
jgi:hypothetical protein